MSQIRTKSDVSLRWAAATDLAFKAAGEGIVQGYASTFAPDPDLHGDVIKPGAYVKTLAAHAKDGTLPALLWSHQLDHPVGKWVRMAEDGNGLHVEGRINLKTERGREAWEHVLAGDATGLSIGFNVPPGAAEYRKDGVTVLHEIDLHEVSVLSVPARSGARITQAKSIGSKGELVDLLREVGLPKTAAVRVAAGGWPALAGADHQKAIDLAATIERATAALKGL